MRVVLWLVLFALSATVGPICVYLLLIGVLAFGGGGGYRGRVVVRPAKRPLEDPDFVGNGGLGTSDAA